MKDLIFSMEVLNLVDSNGALVENGRVFPDSYYDTVGVFEPAGWNSYENSSFEIYNWKPWTEKQIDLSSKVGQKS